MSSRLNITTAFAMFSLFPVAHARAPRAPADPDACSLLTADQVSAAIEAKSQPGEHAGKTSTKSCIWSDDPNHSGDHRRVTLSLTTPTGFKVGKSMPRVTAEPVSGLGDEAYYMIYQSHEAPTLVVRKGDSAFNVRLLNGLNAKGLSEAEVKARELVLAKAAVGKL